MPPKPRTAQQLSDDKQKIIDEALKIVQKHGLASLTIRKLSTKLNMSATNIYNYFYNKDEIYLHILINGFEILQKDQTQKMIGCKDPIDQLEKFMRSFIEFGIHYPSHYQLMFSTQDPKSLDYVGTPIEALANHEKDIAMRTFQQLRDIIKTCKPMMHEDEIKILASRIGCELHGCVNFHHSNIIKELDADPMDVLNNLIQHILLEFK